MAERRIRILIMKSGEDSPQFKPFNTALSTIRLQDTAIDIEWISLVEAKKKGWTSAYFCECACNCDIFIFLCHPLQLDIPPEWDFKAHLTNLYEALKDKICFPNPKALLEDGAFTQDKYLLYERLTEVMNITIKIDRPPRDMNQAFHADVIHEIYFFTRTNEDKRGGWYLKGGYSTGNRGNICVTKKIEIPDKARAIFNRVGLHSIPYVLLQPRMTNNVVSLK